MQGHQTEQPRIWYHFQPCTLPPLHFERFPCWIIATLFAPPSPISLPHKHTHTVSGWEEGGHQLSAVTILSMDRDGRLSATMVWPICIPVSPPGLWHESQTRLPHFHPNIASAKCPFKPLQSGVLRVFPSSQKKKKKKKCVNCVEIFLFNSAHLIEMSEGVALSGG